MDQIKDFLRQAIKYRFWIVVGVATLLPMIAYLATAGPINKETTDGAGAAKSAQTDVQQYVSSQLPNDEWKTLAEQRTSALTKDINQAWRLLYDQQAPLLTWPEEVADQFKNWGKVWPEGYDDAAIRQVAGNYIQVYPRQVEEVYQAFRPFNYEDGTGVVVAPAKEALLRPTVFSIANPPTLGKVWGAQEKLWIQRTVLDVIDKVNADAKDWEGAPVKEITGLEVASPKAQDQKSIVGGEVLELAPEIVKPGTEAAASSTSPASPSSSYESQMSGSRGSMSSMMLGSSSGMGGSTEPEQVYVFKSESTSQPFQKVPVFVSVLIDQRRILDLIAAFENSPMEIKVVDFEMSRPTQRVTKPEKGQTNPSFAGGMGMMGGEMVLGSYSRMSRGGMNTDMMSQMMGSSNMSNYMAGRGMGMGMGMMGSMGAAPAKKSGTDIKKQQLDKLRKKEKGKEGEEEEKEASPKGGMTDPYYDIVEVRLYGQARFYNPPPLEEPASQESEGAVPQDATTAEATAADPSTTPAQAAPAEEAAPTDTSAPPDVAAPAGATAPEVPPSPAADPTAPAADPAVNLGEAPPAPATPSTNPANEPATPAATEPATPAVEPPAQPAAPAAPDVAAPGRM